MKRREFVTLLGGVAAWPLAARAQQPTGAMRRVSVLLPFVETDTAAQAWDRGFRQRLNELGWDSRNIRLDYRWASGNVSRLRSFASELAELKPDVILAVTTPAVDALLAHTRSIPVVFTVVSDPIGSGFVTSLSNPGGNVTGFTNNQDSLAGKWLELLKEIASPTARVTAMFNPNTAPYAEYYLEVASRCCTRLFDRTLRRPCFER